MATDYEKKYKEALERARKLYNDAKANEYKSDMEDYESIFPELVESEDERMMREFNDWLCEKIECLTNDLRDEKDRRTLNMLCYILTKVKDRLKKQKEQKPVPPLPPFDEMTPEDKMNHPLYLEGFDTGREVQKVFDEQKPAEWSEEDEKDMAHIIRILDDCYVYGTHDLSKTDHENLVNKLKSLRPAWKPSEEQMKDKLNSL